MEEKILVLGVSTGAVQTTNSVLVLCTAVDSRKTANNVLVVTVRDDIPVLDSVLVLGRWGRFKAQTSVKRHVRAIERDIQIPQKATSC